MTLKSVLTLALGALVLAGCSSFDVKSEATPGFDFATLKTFQVLPANSGKSATAAPEVSPILLRQAEGDVAASFERHGYEKVESGADFMVSIHAGVHDKLDVTTYGYYPGTVGYWGPYGGRYRGGYPVMGTQVSEYRQGTLVIDVLSAKSKEVVWRGWAQGPASSTPDPERLASAIDAIIAEFPPVKGK